MLVSIDTLWNIGDTVWYLSRRGKPAKGTIRFIELSLQQYDFQDEAPYKYDGVIRHHVFYRFWIKTRSGSTVIKHLPEQPLFNTKELCMGYYNMKFLADQADKLLENSNE